MKTYVAPGHSITVTAPSGGVTSGQGVLIGTLFGIAQYDAIEGAHALRQYQCDPSLHGMLEAGAEPADGADGETSAAAEEGLVKSAMALWRARRASQAASIG